MSSDDIASYLIEIGSGERKLQYCRQILSQNSFFTPQAAFNLNSSQVKTTLLKSELLELFKFTGLTSTQEELELIYSYFQIDGKNYVTLQQFSSIVLPQADNFQATSKKNEKYQIKYSLQKFLLQILDYQMSLKRVWKFTQNNSNESSKLTYKKINLDHLKSFLAFHGKYPNQNTLEQILKEILLDKGIDRRHKITRQYILQFNQNSKNRPSQPKIQSKEIKDMKITNKSTYVTDQIAIKMRKAQMSTDIDKILDKNGHQKTFKNAVMRVNENESMISKKMIDGSVQDRIRSLMSSISIKATKSRQNNIKQFKEDSKFKNKSQYNAKEVVVKQSKPVRQLAEIKVDQNCESKIQLEDNIKVAKRKQAQDDSFTQKINKYKKSKVLSQENSDNVSFNYTSRNVFCSKYSKNLAVQQKQNEADSKQIPDKANKNEKSRRIHYLKSLVQSGSASQPKQVDTYRF